MLAAFAIDWAKPPGAGTLPVGATIVYLRVRRHGTAYDVGAGTLSVGFRATVIQNPAEVPELLALTDRALTRARRHAAILAGTASTTTYATWPPCRPWRCAARPGCSPPGPTETSGSAAWR